MSSASSDEELAQLSAAVAAPARKYRSKHYEKVKLLGPEVHKISPANCQHYRRTTHSGHRDGSLFSLISLFDCGGGEEKRRVGSSTCAQCVTTFLCGVLIGLLLYLLFLLIFIKVYLKSGDDESSIHQIRHRHHKELLSPIVSRTTWPSVIVSTSTTTEVPSSAEWATTTTTMKTPTTTTTTEKPITTSTTTSYVSSSSSPTTTTARSVIETTTTTAIESITETSTTSTTTATPNKT